VTTTWLTKRSKSSGGGRQAATASRQQDGENTRPALQAERLPGPEETGIPRLAPAVYRLSRTTGFSSCASSGPTGKHKDTRSGSSDTAVNPAMTRPAGSARHTPVGSYSANSADPAPVRGQTERGPRPRVRVRMARKIAACAQGTRATGVPGADPQNFLINVAKSLMNSWCRTANQLTTGQPLSRPTVTVLVRGLSRQRVRPSAVH
jgi:hypothetical protein